MKATTREPLSSELTTVDPINVNEFGTHWEFFLVERHEQLPLVTEWARCYVTPCSHAEHNQDEDSRDSAKPDNRQYDSESAFLLCKEDGPCKNAQPNNTKHRWANWRQSIRA